VVYDKDLAGRVRELVAGELGVSEQAMFGGLAFLINGNMAIAVSGSGGILVRVDAADADRLVRSTRADEAVMGGRMMQGWLRVAPEHLGTNRQLAPWVRRGVGYARSLPLKGPRRSRR
jgi:TfoX/Sxy family transcriptional regulator of competence genes